jgi:hypothetical protein
MQEICIDWSDVDQIPNSCTVTDLYVRIEIPGESDIWIEAISISFECLNY